MEEASKEISSHFGAWGYLLVPSVLAVATTLCGAIGWISKSLVRGGTYYAGKVWELLEKAADKHFSFVENTASEQSRQTKNLEEQTKILSRIEGYTAKTSDAMGKFGSDPSKVFAAMKEDMIQELLKAVHSSGRDCKYDEAKKVVEHRLSRSEGFGPSPEPA